MAAHPPWQGELQVGDAWAVWRGSPGQAHPHRHIAAQAVFALDGEVCVQDGAGHHVAAACVLIEPLATHRILSGSAVELVFVEPWCAWPRVGPLSARHEQLAHALRDGRTLPGAIDYWAPHQPVPAATENAWAAHAREQIDDLLTGGRVRLADLAARLQLSAERVRHRFAAETGLPIKRFVLWRRLSLAVTALGHGTPPTEAAHEAGFADAAHLARTLRAMFGISATQLRATQAGGRSPLNGSSS